MKKLMIAAAIVCAATMSRAASTDWSVYMDASAGNVLYAAGSGDGSENLGTPIGGTMYLFNVANIDQGTVYNAIMVSTDVSGTLASLAAANGFAASVEIGSNGGILGGQAALTGPTEGGSYFAVIAATDKNIFFDDAVDGSYNEITGGALYIEPQAWSGDPSYDFTSATSFGETGWYAAPEPTSGLLLLLGVASLALRRRRA